MADRSNPALPITTSDPRTAPFIVPGWMLHRMPATMPARLPPAAAGGTSPPSMVREWLIRLYAVCAGNTSPAEVRARIELVAPMISSRFPLEAFSFEALEHVASLCRFWPSYAELVEHLGAWWRANRPHVPVLAAPDPAEPAPLSPEERAHIAAKLRALGAEMADRIRSREASLLPSQAASGKQGAIEGEALAQLRQARGCMPVRE